MSDYTTEQLREIKKKYTAEELRLNDRLFSECIRDEVDFAVIEELLKKGADPLGALSNDIFAHVYEEVICESQDTNSKFLPEITRLFLKYGMDIKNPRVPYDDGNSINPLWAFTFVSNKNAIVALKFLLDAGLDGDSAAQFWQHSILDLIHLDEEDPNEPYSYYLNMWTFKMIMLVASYDHIIENDEQLRDFIGYEYNDYDIRRFKYWDGFYYKFDTSECEKSPRLSGSVVRIYNKETHEEVWNISLK